MSKYTNKHDGAIWRCLNRLVRCVFDSHNWEWILPNGKGTIIGTQRCRNCGKLRGVRVKPNS